MIIQLFSENGKDKEGSLTVDDSASPNIVLELNVTVKQDLLKKDPVLRLTFDKGPSEKVGLYVTIVQSGSKLSLTSKNAIKKTYVLASELSKKIQSAEIFYIEDNRRVTLFKDLTSLPKKLFITNLLSFKYENALFQLVSYNSLKNGFFPSLNLTSLGRHRLMLTIVLQNTTYNFKLRGNYSHEIEDPVFIGDSTKNIDNLSVTVKDEDTHKTLWFSKQITFPIEPVKNQIFIQAEMLGRKKERGQNPIFLLTEDRVVRILNGVFNKPRLILEVYKNDVFSILYRSELDNPDKKELTLMGEAGPQRFPLKLQDWDTITPTCAKLVTEEDTYLYANNSLRNDKYTLRMKDTGSCYNDIEDDTDGFIIKETMINTSKGLKPVQEVELNTVLISDKKTPVSVKEIICIYVDKLTKKQITPTKNSKIDVYYKIELDTTRYRILKSGLVKSLY